ncbi:MAG: LysM domain-containing protein [Clostridiales bacterium]|nr:LysM domain-containing protein [Clostridiales bacterium]
MDSMKYPCKAGESFDQISLAVYGDEKYAAQLLQANPGYCRRLRFAGGEILNLPVVEVPEEGVGEPASAPWKG